MAIRIANLMKTVDWSWDGDPDHGTDEATVLKFRYLDSYEQAFLQDKMAQINVANLRGQTMTEEEVEANTSVKTSIFTVAVDAVGIALVEAKNLFDDEGDELTVEMVSRNIGGKSKKVADPEVVRALPLNMCLAAYTYIMGMNAVKRGEVKNSDAA